MVHLSCSICAVYTLYSTSPAPCWCILPRQSNQGTSCIHSLKLVWPAGSVYLTAVKPLCCPLQSREGEGNPLSAQAIDPCHAVLHVLPMWSLPLDHSCLPLLPSLSPGKGGAMPAPAAWSLQRGRCDYLLL